MTSDSPGRRAFADSTPCERGRRSFARFEQGARVAPQRTCSQSCAAAWHRVPAVPTIRLRWFLYAFALALVSCARHAVSRALCRIKASVRQRLRSACHDYADSTLDADPLASGADLPTLVRKATGARLQQSGASTGRGALSPTSIRRGRVVRPWMRVERWRCLAPSGEPVHPRAGRRERRPARAGLLEKSCELRYARACFRVSVIIQRGTLTPADHDRAFADMTRGCDLRDATSWHDLGYMYLDGRGTTKAAERAAELLRAAATRKLDARVRKSRGPVANRHRRRAELRRGAQTQHHSLPGR